MLRVKIMKARCSMNQKRTRQKYTKEFKNDAVKLVIEQGYSTNEVGRRLGISQSNVSRWVLESVGMLPPENDGIQQYIFINTEVNVRLAVDIKGPAGDSFLKHGIIPKIAVHIDCLGTLGLRLCTCTQGSNH